MAEDIRNMALTAGVKAFEKKFEKPYCVILDSEYCSMGRMIGYKACEMAGYAFYDAVTLLDLVPEEGITMKDVDAFEAVLRKKELSKEEIYILPDYSRISGAFEKATDRALAKGPCLIHDRATAKLIQTKGYTVFSVFNYATDQNSKLVRARKSPLYAHIEDPMELREKIQEEDRIRINWHKAHSDTRWGDRNTYDLCLNAETLGRDYSAWVLGTIMKGPSQDE